MLSPRKRSWRLGRPLEHILQSLTLASKESVLGLGLEIVLCPWPRALCP